jgi:hypothetical protein
MEGIMIKLGPQKASEETENSVLVGINDRLLKNFDVLQRKCLGPCKYDEKEDAGMRTSLASMKVRLVM